MSGVVVIPSGGDTSASESTSLPSARLVTNYGYITVPEDVRCNYTVCNSGQEDSDGSTEAGKGAYNGPAADNLNSLMVAEPPKRVLTLRVVLLRPYVARIAGRKAFCEFDRVVECIENCIMSRSRRVRTLLKGQSQLHARTPPPARANPLHLTSANLQIQGSYLSRSLVYPCNRSRTVSISMATYTVYISTTAVRTFSDIQPHLISIHRQFDPSLHPSAIKIITHWLQKGQVNRLLTGDGRDASTARYIRIIVDIPVDRHTDGAKQELMQQITQACLDYQGKHAKECEIEVRITEYDEKSLMRTSASA
ncbi:hypothetical protein DOTSEDRAFT_80994 [Dothistroma septosporum NZE10]|uniref:Uncharacterized protein n=1 Tax=Dothistroma septosporum (strain NZE10 / CBS 128990) TaxID=675120 RepID=M2YNT7_DOTSN|nr:hypothetical protein DOTSEDRAFT_80994 [Dothistroma septosporum NZE10]